MGRWYGLLLAFSLSCGTAAAQVLYTEAFAVILDTAKHIKGSVQPDASFRNLRERLFELECRVNMTLRRRRHAWTFANQIEYTRFGKENVLSGGYLFAEYRQLTDTRYVSELYGEVHWQNPRGLRRKYAAGYNARLRLRRQPGSARFLGAGLFYEWEEWTYRGVPAERLPEVTTPVTTSRVRTNLYASLKQRLTEDFVVDASGYVQAPLTEDFGSPRLALAVQLRYQVREYLALQLSYRNLYDPAPVVPVDRLFNRYDFGVFLEF